jgi:hypothetical protein
MKADPLNLLKRIPFTVASLKLITPPGSHEAALVEAVYQAVRQDIEYAIAQIESERKQGEQP